MTPLDHARVYAQEHPTITCYLQVIDSTTNRPYRSTEWILVQGNAVSRRLSPLPINGTCNGCACIVAERVLKYRIYSQEPFVTALLCPLCWQRYDTPPAQFLPANYSKRIILDVRVQTERVILPFPRRRTVR